MTRGTGRASRGSGSAKTTDKTTPTIIDADYAGLSSTHTKVSQIKLATLSVTRPLARATRAYKRQAVGQVTVPFR